MVGRVGYDVWEEIADAHVTNRSARRDGVCYKRGYKLNRKDSQYKVQVEGAMGEGGMEKVAFRIGKLGRGLSASSNPARGGISSRTVIMYKL